MRPRDLEGAQPDPRKISIERFEPDLGPAHLVTGCVCLVPEPHPLISGLLVDRNVPGMAEGLTPGHGRELAAAPDMRGRDSAPPATTQLPRTLRAESEARGHARGARLPRAKRAKQKPTWRRRESNPRPQPHRRSVYKHRLHLRFARRPECNRPTDGLAILCCRAPGDWLSLGAEPVG